MGRSDARPPDQPRVIEPGPDLREVKGQETARRAIEIAAAGGHSLLLVGPTGAGKTLLARCLPSLLPPLTAAERAIREEIHRKARLPHEEEEPRPFHPVPPTLTPTGLLGGGRPRHPGAANLAHGGYLFLDDLTAYRTRTLAALLQPLEDGRVHLEAGPSLPARFSLIATMRPCPCGGAAGEPPCLCRRSRITRHWCSLLPLVERFGITVEMPEVQPRDLLAHGEGSEAVARRIAAAHRLQLSRLGACHPFNAWMSEAKTRELCGLDRASRALRDAAWEGRPILRRRWGAVLRVARTLADLGGGGPIRTCHLAEAIQYRSFDPREETQRHTSRHQRDG